MVGRVVKLSDAGSLAIAADGDDRLELGVIALHATVDLHDRGALGVELSGIGVVVHTGILLYIHTVLRRDERYPDRVGTGTP